MLIFILFQAASVAYSIGFDSNRVDPYAIEFKHMGKALVRMFEREEVMMAFLAVVPKKLEEAVTNTTIITVNLTERTDIDPITGAESCTEVDALNFPITLSNPIANIELSISRWEAPGQYFANRASITLHEYMGILGTEVNQYSISARMEEVLKSGNFALEEFKHDLRHVLAVYSLAIKERFAVNAERQEAHYLKLTTSKDYQICTDCSLPSDRRNSACKRLAGASKVGSGLINDSGDRQDFLDRRKAQFERYVKSLPESKSNLANSLFSRLDAVAQANNKLYGKAWDYFGTFLNPVTSPKRQCEKIQFLYKGFLEFYGKRIPPLVQEREAVLKKELEASMDVVDSWQEGPNK